MPEKTKIAACFSDPGDRQLVAGYLAGSGYEFVDFSGKVPDRTDLVILDVASARRIGGQVLAQAKKAGDFLPVLLVLGRDEDIGQWFESGFDDYLRRPLVRSELKARVEIILRLRQQSKKLAGKSEYIHRALIESSSDHIFMLDAKGMLRSSNNRVACLDFPSGDEITGKSLEEVYPQDIARRYREHLAEVLASGSTRTFEYDLPVSRDVLHHLVTLYPVKLPDGEKMAGGICRDITRQKQIETALRESEDRYKGVFEHTGTATLIINQDGTIALANEECKSIMGFSPKDLQGTLWTDYVAPESLEAMKTYFKLRFDRPELAPSRYEARLINAHGEARDSLLSVGCIPVTRQVVVSVLDITDRVRAEKDRQLLATAIEHTVECVFITDRRNRIIYANKAFEKITGYSCDEARGKTPGILKSDRNSQKFYSRLKADIYAGRPWRGNMVNRRKDGSYYEVFATITPILDSEGEITHFVSVHRDVTREREIERRVQQNQRLEAIGTMAGGIAHDFNNILSPIMGYTELCMGLAPPGSRLSDYLRQVLTASNRARQLIKQILSFSRNSAREPKPLNIVPVLKETLKLLRAAIPATIEIREHIEPVSHSIMFDPSEMQRIIMNLCTNAQQAMPDGGILTVALGAINIDREFAETHPNFSPGTYLKLTVKDTGNGIPADIIDKIFEPYFTTKEEGVGTGLGLAVVHGSVTAVGGAITVYSEPGRGTEFNLYFPALSAAPEENHHNGSVRGGHENIIFVDDESFIADLGAEMLEVYGYKVQKFTDPVKALELIRGNPDAFDMLITDMTMPGMTGEHLARKVLELRPDMPVILCTGFSEQMNAEKAERLGIKKFLIKPVSPKELARSVRDLLDKK